MKCLYLHCFSGISGDMTLAALVDAGADRAYIERELAKLEMDAFRIEWTRVNKCGISSLKMDVHPDPDAPPKHHRHYSDIVKMIESAGLSERAAAWSLKVFEIIGRAEGKIHHMPLEKVHFHEVGAIDSIVDVVGIALALDSLNVDRVYSSPVPVGTGTVKCDHGFYPVPAPATLEMLKGVPIAPSTLPFELTTPTGAGVAAGLVDEFSPGLPAIVVESIGYGAGTRDIPNRPNVLRAVIGTAEQPELHRMPPIHAHEPDGHSHHHHHHEHHHEHGHDHGHGHNHDRDHDHGHTHDHDHEHTHSHDHADHKH